MRRGQLLDGCGVMKDMKVMITHGRCDYVCQPQAAYRLASVLVRRTTISGVRNAFSKDPKRRSCAQEKVGADVNLEFVAGAGHSDSEPGLVDAMVRATDGMREALK